MQAFRALSKLAALSLLLKAEAIASLPQLVPYLGQGQASNKECHLTYHNALLETAPQAANNKIETAVIPIWTHNDHVRGRLLVLANVTDVETLQCNVSTLQCNVSTERGNYDAFWRN